MIIERKLDDFETLNFFIYRRSFIENSGGSKWEIKHRIQIVQMPWFACRISRKYGKIGKKCEKFDWYGYWYSPSHYICVWNMDIEKKRIEIVTTVLRCGIDKKFAIP